MSEVDSFERLVSDLSPEEREEMLEKMQGYVGNPEEESLSPSPIEDMGILFDAQLKNESLFLRLWLWIKSLFTSVPVESLFNDYRIQSIYRSVERRSPNLVDLKHRKILSLFFTKITELKKCADFFKAYCAAADLDMESFYVNLGSLAMAQVEKQMSETVDPYIMPVAQGSRSEMRVTLLRRMDELLAAIPPEQKNVMYSCARATEWLIQFVRLPYNRFLSQFSSLEGNSFSVPFNLIADDIKQFAKVLCNGCSIPNEVLETMYLVQRGREGGRRNKDFEEASQFIAEAHEQLSLMHHFVTTVPMRAISCLVRNDSYFLPENLPGAEDWFIKYKMGWKKLFDQKWEAWLIDCKKEAVRQSLQKDFGLDAFPLLPERPWEDCWGRLRFRYELTAGFLSWFFREKFSSYELILKTVLTEGDFLRKENRLELTESLNNYVQVSIGLNSMAQMICPSGELGMQIAKLEHDHTLPAVQRCEQVMHSMESDFGHYLVTFGDASRKMILLLEGILGVSTDTRYDSLTNLNLIQGAGNAAFKRQLQEIYLSLRDAFSMIKELEPVDMPPAATI